MEIRVAKSAGFCTGVKRAVQMALSLKGKNAVTYGPLIHNPQMINMLASIGIGMIQDPEEVSKGQTVIIRAHGIPPRIRERLAVRGASVVDATCPCVARVYTLIQNANHQGREIIIIGEAQHPEVVGIAGYAERVHIVESSQEAQLLPHISKAAVVAQTTFEKDCFAQIVACVKQRVEDLTVFDTTCGATKARQAEAISLASEVDQMIVIGGYNSSNTLRLYELCSAHCPAYHIETAADLPRDALGKARVVGVTAGASTPDWILKEVLTEMTDMEKMDNIPQEEDFDSSSQDSFQEAMEKTLVTIRSGHTVSGVIVQITEDEVCVNIGYKSDGIIPKSELSVEGDPRENYALGQEIEVEVMKVNDGEGNVLLSQKNIANKKNWDLLVVQHENQEIVEGVGKEVVKGGLLADVMGIRTFIPASQLADRYVEKMDEFVGQPLRLRIIELDSRKRRLVASRKQVLLEEREGIRAKLWETLEEGAVIQGVVRRLTDFGAFVDIGGLDGLIHVTDLSWGRVKHPSDVVSIGQELEVLILALDREKQRISLGIKQLQKRPWDTAVDHFPVGSIVEGTVVRIVTFGAFVELEPGLDGLVHISQISDERVNKVEDKLEIGQVVRVKVLDVNTESKRISLSIRDAVEYAGEAEAVEDSVLDNPVPEYAEAVPADAGEYVEPDPQTVDNPVVAAPEGQEIGGTDE